MFNIRCDTDIDNCIEHRTEKNLEEALKKKDEKFIFKSMRDRGVIH